MPIVLITRGAISEGGCFAGIFLLTLAFRLGRVCHVAAQLLSLTSPSPPNGLHCSSVEGKKERKKRATMQTHPPRKQNLAYAQLKKAASNILADLSSMWLSLHEGPGRQKVSKQFHVFMLKPCKTKKQTRGKRKKKKKLGRALHIHTHAAG